MYSTSGSCNFVQRHDVPFVLAPDIQHGRLILAKRYPRFQIVFCVSDGLGKMAPLNLCFALCVATNQTMGHGVLGA